MNIFSNFCCISLSVWLTLALLVLGTTNLLMVISPWSWLMDFMGLYHETNKHMMFRLALLLMVATHMVLSYSTEVCTIIYMFHCSVSLVLNGKIFELMRWPSG